MKLAEFPLEETSNMPTSLAESVTRAVEDYFSELKGHESVGVYQLVMEEIEIPLLKVAMKHCQYNQSRAAVLLGLSRGTLRTKLKKYFDNKYL